MPFSRRYESQLLKKCPFFQSASMDTSREDVSPRKEIERLLSRWLLSEVLEARSEREEGETEGGGARLQQYLSPLLSLVFMEEGRTYNQSLSLGARSSSAQFQLLYVLFSKKQKRNFSISFSRKEIKRKRTPRGTSTCIV